MSSSSHPVHVVVILLYFSVQKGKNPNFPVFFKLILILRMNPGHTEDNYSVITSESCTCPGDELIFECTIEGDAGTYWQGTALEQCLQGRILIRHTQFLGGGHTERNACGASGTAIARTISAVNNTLFTTQLTIFANQRLNGSTVMCISDRGRVIGQSQIWLKTGSYIG